MDLSQDLLGRIELPRRTELASLVPIGLGTPYVESLSSYFQRLASCHSVSPKALARSHILKRLGFNKRVGEEQADRFWRTSFFNGMGEVPEAWCRILEELTGVTGLRRLTLLPLQGRVSIRGCSSPVKRWCPHCLFESEASGEAYGQLLWEIGCVKACPKHGVPLEDAHGCSAVDAIRPIQVKRLPHVCPSCARSLARPFHEDAELAPEEDLVFVRVVGELLAGRLYGAEPVPAGRGIADFLEDILTVFEGGNGMQGAQRLGVNKSDLSGWVNRKHLPGLVQAIHISRTYWVPISDVLMGNGGNKKNILKPLQRQRLLSFQLYRPRGRVPDVEYKLKKFLAQDAPPSVTEAAGLLGTSSRELYRLHPEMAHALAEKHAVWKSQDATQRREERLAVVREVVDQIISEGLVPTMARLEERLDGVPKSFLFQERVACKRICEDGKIELIGNKSH